MDVGATSVTVADLHFGYGASSLLRGISLHARSGEVLGILGSNGAGKTTILRLMAGLLTPQSGQVQVGGQDLASLNARARAQAIALVMPLESVPFAFRAHEIVLMGRHPRFSHVWIDGTEDLDVTRQSMERLDVWQLRSRLFNELSQGEKQRVLLARALAQETPVILLDEPTSHLDPAHALSVARLCREFAAEGRTLVAVFHDVNLAAQASDRLAFLGGGELLAEGTPDEVLTPANLEKVYGVQARRVDGSVPAVVFEAS